MNARYVLLAAAVAMGAIETVAIFAEAVGAVVLAVLFLLLAAWLWFRESVWPVALLAVWFLLEIVYLWDYDWGVTSDRLMIIATLVVAGTGLVAAVAWFVQWWRDRRVAARTAQ